MAVGGVGTEVGGAGRVDQMTVGGRELVVADGLDRSCDFDISHGVWLNKYKYNNIPPKNAKNGCQNMKLRKQMANFAAEFSLCRYERDF